MKLILCVSFVFLVEIVKNSMQQTVWLVSCDGAADCDKLSNATCVDSYCYCGVNFSVCNCKEGYTASNDSKQCVEVSGVGSPCSTTEDCNRSQESINRFVCTNGECKCHSNYSEENGRCTETGSSSSSRLKDFMVLPWFLWGLVAFSR